MTRNRRHWCRQTRTRTDSGGWSWSTGSPWPGAAPRRPMVARSCGLSCPPSRASSLLGVSDGQATAEHGFEEVLQYLKESRGFDFTGYKRTSLMRRVRHRMTQIGVEDYGDYIDQLQVNSDEFNVLFNTILINVTAFFRDTEAWNYLREEVIPTLLAERGPDDPIRVWSAGCASGEEAYSLAIALAEAIGPERFRQQV